MTARLHYIVFELLLLVDIEADPREAQTADASFVIRHATHYVYKRTGADALLEWLTRVGAPVGIWTHETRRLARATLRRVFPKLRTAFVYTRRSSVVHENVYVKDVRKLGRNSLLVDFNTKQIVYHLEQGIKVPTLIEPTGDLVKIRNFLRRRLSPQYNPVIVV